MTREEIQAKAEQMCFWTFLAGQGHHPTTLDDVQVDREGFEPSEALAALFARAMSGFVVRAYEEAVAELESRTVTYRAVATDFGRVPELHPQDARVIEEKRYDIEAVRALVSSVKE